MLRALTLQQPWAFAVMHLGKRVENRTWKPPKVIIGTRFAIHAGKTFDQPGDNKLRSWLRAWEEYELLEMFTKAKLDRGAIVGTVICTGYAKSVENPAGGTKRAYEYKTPLPDRNYPQALVFSRWAAVGCYQWGLANPTPLKTPLQCNGSQGVWTVHPDLEDRVLAATV